MKPNSHAPKYEHNGFTISYMFCDFLSALMMALKKSRNMYEIVYLLCLTIWCMWIWFDTWNFVHFIS